MTGTYYPIGSGAASTSRERPAGVLVVKRDGKRCGKQALKQTRASEKPGLQLQGSAALSAYTLDATLLMFAPTTACGTKRAPDKMKGGVLLEAVLLAENDEDRRIDSTYVCWYLLLVSVAPASACLRFWCCWPLQVDAAA